MNSSEPTDYPFLEDWERQQQEPDNYPPSGSLLFGKHEPSPLAIERLPERKTEYRREEKT